MVSSGLSRSIVVGSVGGPGDFLFVPKGAIHRKANPGDIESQIVVARGGHGPPVFNVDGPAES